MIIDSGATCHVISDKAMAEGMRNKRKATGEKISMNGHLEDIVMRGDIDAWLTCGKTGKQVMLTLKDVAFCPQSEHALFSTTAYLDQHKKAHPHLENAIVQTSGGICIESGDEQVHGERRGDLCFFNFSSHRLEAASTAAAVSVAAGCPAGREASGEGSTPSAAKPETDFTTDNPWAPLATTSADQ
jgi:hypothetical protein